MAKNELMKALIFLLVFFLFGIPFPLAGIIPVETCESLYQKYKDQIIKYDGDKDGRISYKEIKVAERDFLESKIAPLVFFGLLSYLRQNCKVIIENQPVSGSLEASAKSVKVGEKITLTIKGKDGDGVMSVYVWYHGRWHLKTCPRTPECTASFTFSESKPGIYEYYGYVYGVHSQKGSEGNWTTPGSPNNPLKVKVKPEVEVSEDLVQCVEFSISPTTTSPGQTFNLRVSGKDDNGIFALYYVRCFKPDRDCGSWIRYDCRKQTTCSYSWTLSESATGTYYFYAGVMGYKTDGKTEWAWCNNRQPLKVEVKVVTPSPELCMDSDGGKDYFVKGTVTYQGISSTDYCVDNKRLVEYYCITIGIYCPHIGQPISRPIFEIYLCPNECRDGACVKEEEKK